MTSLNEEFIELIAESDEALLERFFEDGELSDDDIRSSLSSAIANGSVIPVFCSSATSNVGVKRINEYISKYMPSALTVQGRCDSNADLQAFIFKTINEEHVGELSFFKVYSGSLSSGDHVENINLSSSSYLLRQNTMGEGFGLDFGFSTERDENGWMFGLSIINMFANIKWNHKTNLDEQLDNFYSDIYSRTNLNEKEKKKSKRIR